MKCPICKRNFGLKIDVIKHINVRHYDVLPKNMSPSKYYYSLNHGGETSGKCRICNDPTNFDEITGRAKILCLNPKCKEKFAEIARENNTKKFGVPYLTRLQSHQMKMLSKRKISGEYQWSNNINKIPYVGSYERRFLEFLDNMLDFDPTTIYSPCPFDVYYEYEGELLTHTPDFYIDILDLIIEIKHGGKNPNMHPKFQAVDVIKDQLKEKAIKEKTTHNYIKLTDNDFHSFMKIMFQLVEDKQFEEKSRRIIINESDGSIITDLLVINEDFHADEMKLRKDEGISMKDIDIKKDLEKLEKKMDLFTEEEAIVQLLSSYKRNGYNTHLLMKFRDRNKNIIRWVRTSELIIDPQEYINYDKNIIHDIESEKVEEVKQYILNKDKKLPVRFGVSVVNENSEITNTEYYLLNESIIFDKEDIELHLDKWKKEKGKNILYVTGLSGSGKSTLAEHMASKYNAEMFELDGLEGNYDSSESNFLDKYKKLHPNLGKLLDSREFLKLQDAEKFEEYKRFFPWLIKEMHSNPNKLYIVEGMVIYDLNVDFIKNNPIIIKGSSVLTSIIQRIKRGTNGIITLKVLFEEIFKSKRYMYQYQDEKKLSKFRKDIVNEQQSLADLSPISTNLEYDPFILSENGMYYNFAIAENNSDIFLIECTELNDDTIGSYDFINETISPSFTKIPATKENINRIKNNYPRLRHVRTDINTKGIILLDGDKFVAVLQTDITTGFIIALEVSSEYRGKGIASDLLNEAKRLGVYKLTVNKKNNVAIDLYKRKGYKIYKQTNDMNFMSTKKVVNESSDLENPDTLCVHLFGDSMSINIGDIDFYVTTKCSKESLKELIDFNDGKFQHLSSEKASNMVSNYISSYKYIGNESTQNGINKLRRMIYNEEELSSISHTSALSEVFKNIFRYSDHPSIMDIVIHPDFQKVKLI